MSTNNSTIIIERTSQRANRMRSINIYDDKQLIGSVKNGETKEFSIAPGSHELSAKIDWCKTAPLKLTINPGEKITLSLGSDLTGLKQLAVLYYIIFDTKNFIYLREK